jgi:chromosome segregation ATPase
MGTDGVKEKELFRNIGFLSNEVIQIQKTLHSIDSEQSKLKAAFDELTLAREILVEQTGHLETIVKQAANSALQDAESESEYRQKLESENSALQTQIKESEQTLQTKEALVKELHEEFASKIEELNGQIREKESLLQMRDIALADLKTATESLNRLFSGVSSSGEGPIELLDEAQDNLKDDASDMIKEIEQRTSTEIERLKNELKEKILALEVKSLENQKIKETMGGKIDELEKILDSKRNKKSPRLVSMLADMGGKRFI